MPDTINIQKVFDDYSAELGRMESRMLDLFKSDVAIISTIGRHIIKSGGKRMRPVFLLASAAMNGYKGEDHIKLASIIEIVHTASLLHDDVVDGADFRRGNPSAHSLWGNQVVILVGDYLYSNALKMTISLHDHRVNETLSAATTLMTQGELKQLEKSQDMSITEDEYFQIISAKTGALISAATSIGGIICGCSTQEESALRSFGLKTGNAFQVVDDILDYMAEEEDLGKKLGKDLGEGKVTLPLIYLLRMVNEAERDIIRKAIEEDISEENLRAVMGLFRRYDAIGQAMNKARSLVEEAKRELDIFPASAHRSNLWDMADYALVREK